MYYGLSYGVEIGSFNLIEFSNKYFQQLDLKFEFNMIILFLFSSLLGAVHDKYTNKKCRELREYIKKKICKNKIWWYDNDYIESYWEIMSIFYNYSITTLAQVLWPRISEYDRSRALASSQSGLSTELIWPFAATALWAKAVLHKFRSRLDSNLYCGTGLVQDSCYITRALNHQKLLHHFPFVVSVQASIGHDFFLLIFLLKKR